MLEGDKLVVIKEEIKLDMAEWKLKWRFKYIMTRKGRNRRGEVEFRTIMEKNKK